MIVEKGDAAGLALLLGLVEEDAEGVVADREEEAKEHDNGRRGRVVRASCRRQLLTMTGDCMISVKVYLQVANDHRSDFGAT